MPPPMEPLEALLKAGSKEFVRDFVSAATCVPPSRTHATGESRPLRALPGCLDIFVPALSSFAAPQASTRHSHPLPLLPCSSSRCTGYATRWASLRPAPRLSPSPCRSTLGRSVRCGLSTPPLAQPVTTPPNPVGDKAPPSHPPWEITSTVAAPQVFSAARYLVRECTYREVRRLHCCTSLSAPWDAHPVRWYAVHAGCRLLTV
jgi:hypothetical protein